MDKIKDWNAFDELEDLDTLMENGAVAEDTSFSLDDIMREYGADVPAEAPEAESQPQAAAPDAPGPEEPETPQEDAAEPDPMPAFFDPAAEGSLPDGADEMDALAPEPAPEPASEPVPEESAPSEEDAPPTPIDLSNTADFIRQQVNEVMGPEEEEDEPANALKSFFIDARRRSSAKRRQRERERRERAAEAALNAAMAAEEEDNVVEMPVSRLKPLRDKVNRLQDKANDFADNMWSEAGAPSEEEQITEQYIPGTDEEHVPARAKKERKPRIPLKTFPDTPSEELAARYRQGLRFMSRRLGYLVVLTLILLYVNLAPDCGFPLPFGLADHTRYLAAGMTWGLGLAALIGLDVIWLGLTAPFRGRPGMHTLTAAALIATLLDGTYYTFVGRDGPLPFAAMAAFSLLCSVWGAYDRKRALYISCRSIATSAEPYRVTLDDNKWDGASAFNKEVGTEEGFGRQIQSLDGAERLYRIFVPILLIAAVLCAVVASFGQGKPELFLWCLSSILVAGAPASGLLAFGLPYLRLTRRLDRSGAVIAGWDGVEAMSGKANILIKDEDLFPPGSITLNSTKSFYDTSIEKLTGCAASMLRAAGSGLYHLFDDEIRRQGGFYRRVDELECYEAGGMTAKIRGQSVMIGTSGFMTVMRVPLDQGLKLKRAVLCVIDNRLEGLFTLNYELSHYARSSINALIRAGVHPVLVTRDFNITPEMLRVQFALPDDQMEYPPIQRRRELSEPDQEHNPVIGALLPREGMGAYSDAIIGGRRLRNVVRLNAALAILSSIIGIALTFYLVSILAFTSLTPLNMMAFLLIWLIPTLAISGAVDRF